VPGRVVASKDLPNSVIHPLTVQYITIDMTSTEYIFSSNNGDEKKKIIKTYIFT